MHRSGQGAYGFLGPYFAWSARTSSISTSHFMCLRRHLMSRLRAPARKGKYLYRHRPISFSTLTLFQALVISGRRNLCAQSV